MHKRSSGILVHLTSLPGPFGVGTFGPETAQFIDCVRAAGFTYWQVLPLTLVDEYHSPYKTVSAFAGNPLFIDPRGLVADGLLRAEEVSQLGVAPRPDVANYTFAIDKSEQALRLAFTRVTPTLQHYIDAFVHSERFWLEDYAVFSVARMLYQQIPWWKWPDRKLASHQPEAVSKFREKYAEEIAFCYFQQWVFHRQWMALKQRANLRGLGIIGDLPFYVDQNSSDVWANRELFQMKGNRFVSVAGVPPDYFAREGQLWGNPLYNWSAHQKEGFRWWQNRLQHALQRFDRVRLDHFRAVVNYWSIPAEAQTAAEGHWEKGPGTAFYSAVLGKVDSSRLFMEDLGDLEAWVRKALRSSGLDGMEVIQFSFQPGDPAHLPYQYGPQSVAYTGTHDNTTLLGWIWEMQEYQRTYVLEYLHFPPDQDWGKGGADSPFCRSMIRQLWMSAAGLTVVPIQDLCGFGGDTRMNVPGRATENWGYRLPIGALESVDWAYWKRMNDLYGRSAPVNQVQTESI